MDFVVRFKALAKSETLYPVVFFFFILTSPLQKVPVYKQKTSCDRTTMGQAMLGEPKPRGVHEPVFKHHRTSLNLHVLRLTFRLTLFSLRRNISHLLLKYRDKMKMERVMGIEPTYLAWKANVLPLNYTRSTQSENQFRTQ